jgi:voltage-gated potassium channel Kch
MATFTWNEVKEPPVDIPSIVRTKLLHIHGMVDSTKELLFRDYPEVEVATFSDQVEEAKMVLSGDTDPNEVILLSGIAIARGISLQDLATLVVGHNTRVKQILAPILGEKQSLELQLKALEENESTTKEDVYGVSLTKLETLINNIG